MGELDPVGVIEPVLENMRVAVAVSAAPRVAVAATEGVTEFMDEGLVLVRALAVSECERIGEADTHDDTLAVAEALARTLSVGKAGDGLCDTDVLRECVALLVAAGLGVTTLPIAKRAPAVSPKKTFPSAPTAGELQMGALAATAQRTRPEFESSADMEPSEQPTHTVRASNVRTGDA